MNLIRTSVGVMTADAADGGRVARDPFARSSVLALPEVLDLIGR
ncbi:hypothetical protein ACH4OQ_03415 [Streptomyces luteogriseus]